MQQGQACTITHAEAHWRESESGQGGERGPASRGQSKGSGGPHGRRMLSCLWEAPCLRLPLAWSTQCSMPCKLQAISGRYPVSTKSTLAGPHRRHTCHRRVFVGEGRNSGGCRGSSRGSKARKSATKAAQPSRSYSSENMSCRAVTGEVRHVRQANTASQRTHAMPACARSTTPGKHRIELLTSQGA